MSLRGILKSLKSIVKDPANFNKGNFENTREYLKKFEFVIANSAFRASLKISKRIAYICNQKLKSTSGPKLRFSEEVLLGFLRSSTNNQLKINESILKLLIITYINESFLYEISKPFKSIESLIKAVKITEKYELKSYKGKLLKFISKLRLCELHIRLEKFGIAINYAQQVLKEVLVKLEKHKKNKKILTEIGMAAVTAFYRIGICEESLENKKAAETAFENANLLGKKYLNKDQILLELDYEAITHRRLRSSRLISKKSLKSSGSFSDKKSVSIKTEKNKAEETNLLKVNLSPIERRTSSIEVSENNRIKRYYSSEKLEKILKNLNQEENPKIFSPDNYFFNKISKRLAIGELKFIPNDARKIIDEQVEELWKNKESLKKKKQNFGKTNSINIFHDEIEKRLENLEEKFENRLKLQDIQIKSKLKTKVYKNILSSINVIGKPKIYPLQRLFFRPPERKKNYQKTSGQQFMKMEPLDLHSARAEDINQEIEDQLEVLLQEMNGQSGKQVKDNEKNFNCQLAKSTLRPKSSHTKIKSSIRNVMIPSKPPSNLKTPH